MLKNKTDKGHISQNLYLINIQLRYMNCLIKTFFTFKHQNIWTFTFVYSYCVTWLKIFVPDFYTCIIFNSLRCNSYFLHGREIMKNKWRYFLLLICSMVSLTRFVLKIYFWFICKISANFDYGLLGLVTKKIVDECVAQTRTFRTL